MLGIVPKIQIRVGMEADLRKWLGLFLKLCLESYIQGKKNNTYNAQVYTPMSILHKRLLLWMYLIASCLLGCFV